MRILLTCFGPFGEHEMNASAEVARQLAAEGVAGVDLVIVELPVVRGDASRLVVEAYERERPDAVVMLGIAGKRAEVTPERVAINVDDYRIPDNAGNQPVDEPIVEGGPAAYFSTLPVKRIVEALGRAGLPASLSNTAGAYICNHVFYAALHHLDRAGASNVPAGFVHIPQMSEAADDAAPSLPLEDLVRAVAVVLREVAGTMTPHV